MTTSSVRNPLVSPLLPPPAEKARSEAKSSGISQPSDAEMAAARLQFAALLGINPATMTGPGLQTAGDSRQKFAAAATTPAAPAASDTASPVIPPPADSVPAVGVKDVAGPTYSAGTVVDGMVSAGPMSSGLSSMTGVAPVETGTHYLATATDAASFNYDPIAMIQDRLAKRGVSDAGITFERWTDNVLSPGGSRVNQYVRATFSNGVTENYAVERVLQNPDITADEIKGLIARGYQPA